MHCPWQKIQDEIERTAQQPNTPRQGKQITVFFASLDEPVTAPFGTDSAHDQNDHLAQRPLNKPPPPHEQQITALFAFPDSHRGRR